MMKEWLSNIRLLNIVVMKSNIFISNKIIIARWVEVLLGYSGE